MQPTSCQPFLNFKLFDFYPPICLHFCFILCTISYFLFIVFLNLFDLSSNVLYSQNYLVQGMVWCHSLLRCFFFVLILFILFGFLIIIILLKNSHLCFVACSKMEFVKYHFAFFILELKNYYYKLDIKNSITYHNFLFLLFLVNYYMKFLNLL